MLNSSLRSSGENYRECRENVSFYDIYVQWTEPLTEGSLE